MYSNDYNCLLQGILPVTQILARACARMVLGF